jgi:hypothetical protein
MRILSFPIAGWPRTSSTRRRALVLAPAQASGLVAAPDEGAPGTGLLPLPRMRPDDRRRAPPTVEPGVRHGHRS